MRLGERMRSGYQPCWSSPPAALSEFALAGVLPARCVLAHLWVRVADYGPWRGSWRFHDTSFLY